VTSTQAPQSNPTGIARFVPILQWAPRYRGAWLRPDLLAGLTVAALVIPKSLGYATIAGVPIQYGLYAAAAGAILYAVFGTSRQIATGPSSALAAIAAGSLVSAGVSTGSDDAIQLVAAITIASGVLFFLLAVLRMGWISQFLSKAVITGFLFGAAIQVVIGELTRITGTSAEGSNSWQQLFDWIGGLADTDGTTLLVGVASLAVVFGLKFLAPRVPGSLVLVVLGLAASVLFDLGDRGVALIGDVPSGLPSIVLPDLGYFADNFVVILTAAVGLLLIGFSQTAGASRSFAGEHRYRIDINQESLAQSMSNLGSGVLQGIPVSASLSASALSDQSGAKTQLASLTTGVLVVLTMLFLAPVFSDLPEPVLAALIIEAVVMGMMDLPAMRRLYRVSRGDFWIAIAAILGVIGAGVLAGVVIGIVLSIVWLVYRSANPDMPELGRKSESQVFRSLEDHPDGETTPGLVILRFDAGLFFANSDSLEDRLRELVLTAEPPLRVIVLDFEGVNFIDAQGSGEVGTIVDSAARTGISVRLTRVKRPVREMLQRDGLIDKIGAGNVYGNVYESVVDIIGSSPGSTSSPDLADS
jgi:SulP family sulfate permease